jgi:uncharacterized membrane protein YgcG
MINQACMKVIGLTLFIYLVGMLSSQAQLNSRWVTRPVVVDGISNDWSQGLNFYDAKTKLLYGVANDSNNVYLCFQEPDQMNQMRIMRAGITVRLSTKGKNKNDVSITFPQKEQESVKPSERENGQRPDMNQFKERFLLENTAMAIHGFATPDGIVPIHNVNGLNVAINWDSTGRMNYEVAIPWKEFIKTNFPAGVTSDVSLEVTINALQMQRTAATPGAGMGSGNMGRRGGGMRGGGGGMGGGGMRRGGSGGGYNRSELFTPVSLKQKVHLAMSQ